MSLFSKNWYLVESLKPRLKPQVEITPQQQRGERAYALRDPVSGSIQLYTEQAYTVVGLMNGERSLNDIWLLAGDSLQDALPTQQDVISLVASLYQLDMLYLDAPGNALDLFQRRDKKQEKKRLQKLYSPLSVQIPLWDPTRFLDRFCPLVDRLMGKWLLALYLLVTLTGLVVAAQHFEALTANAADRILAAENLFLLWFLYPLVKIIHELGHAVIVRRYGGQVHEVGVMFLVFFPMPYVNASESAAFSSKYQRMTVAAAGLIVELFIAAVAVILWSMASEGMVKSMLYNVAFMAGVSTLLFNGNPLLKFDAYYVLSDYLEIPNLAKKSVSYWGYLVKRYVFRFRELEDPAQDLRERYWLFFYNLFSFVYRVVISISIILFIGSQYFVVGVMLGIWTLVSSWVIPFVKTVSKPFTEPQFAYQGLNPKWVMAVLALMCWGLLFKLPLPYSYTAAGVSWTEPHERLYAGESGFVERIQLPADGQVLAGQELIILTNYELLDRLASVKAQLQEARSRVRSAYQDRARSSLGQAEVTRFQDELADIESALLQTSVQARTNGRMVVQDPQTLPHRYLKRGEIIGYVLHPERPLTVRVAVAETAAERVLGQVQGVSLRPASDRSEEIPATLAAVVPRVSKEIPSPVLSTQGGGEIILDPSSDQALQSLENYVLIEVEAAGLPMTRVFERFYVRFDLPSEPLAKRLYRQLRQVFIEEFDV
ncbi:hypothetical protein G8770_12275 [Aestuariicella hydrocarbonica]|uniref:Peptidase M50 domain-containing protein n=1 Tax=Pseudomaricurvus hydrocarbonicus TaxID=1470433 RepID=A0A9E5K0H6_9GAMM|nr:site-2 protease family protein [Aestuariicella hydrocarbonica]NHO66317.1 hypothetical protein [Aestuariicella hydrocarbonica]